MKTGNSKLPERNSFYRRGYYIRGGLPHYNGINETQFVTFRLLDSLPSSVLVRIQSELDKCNEGERGERSRRYYESCLDRGLGNCILADSDVAEIVKGSLLHFNGSRYNLMAWVIMPNHVHVVVTLRNEYALSSVVHSWKSYSARAINRIRKTSGSIWQRDYFDRLIRNDFHLEKAISYVEDNPVKAGLVSHPKMWKFSSAAPRSVNF